MGAEAPLLVLGDCHWGRLSRCDTLIISGDHRSALLSGAQACRHRHLLELPDHPHDVESDFD